MIRFKVKFDDKEMYDEIVKQRATLRVGFFDDQYYEEIEKPFYSNVAKPGSNKPRRFSARKKIPIAQVALAQEYGVPEKHIPARPFMRGTVNRNFRKWKKFVQDYLPQKMNAKEVMEELGQIVVQDMKKVINDWSEPPNSPYTVKQKGFNNPLIDTRTMVDNVRMEVE